MPPVIRRSRWEIGALARAPWRPVTPLPLDSAHYDCGRLVRRPVPCSRERLRGRKKAGCKSLLLPEPAAGQKKDRRDPIPTAGVAGGSAIFQPPGSCFPAAGPVWGFIATSVSKTVTAVGADSLSRVASQPNRGIAPCQTPPGTVAAATSVFQRRLMPPPEAESPVLSDRTVPSWIGFRGTSASSCESNQHGFSIRGPGWIPPDKVKVSEALVHCQGKSADRAVLLSIKRSTSILVGSPR